MEKNDLTRLAIGAIIVCVVVPVIIDGAAAAIDLIGNSVGTLIHKVKFTRAMKKLVKEGKVIKIESDYYIVETPKED